MKRLLILKTPYKPTPDERAQSFKQLRACIKPIPWIKLLKEMDGKPQVIVEFDEERSQEAYDTLRKIEVVLEIDTMLPAGE